MGNCVEVRKEVKPETLKSQITKTKISILDPTCEMKMNCKYHGQCIPKEQKQKQKYGFQSFEIVDDDVIVNQICCWIVHHPILYYIAVHEEYQLNQLRVISHGCWRGCNDRSCTKDKTSNSISIDIHFFLSSDHHFIHHDFLISILLHEMAHCEVYGHMEDFHQIETRLRTLYNEIDSSVVFPPQPTPRSYRCQCYHD